MLIKIRGLCEKWISQSITFGLERSNIFDIIKYT